MKLIKARVQNFRSIEDSNEFSIEFSDADRDSNVTCFVGKNEAGKTALLTALYRVNPVFGDSTFDKEREYPRRMFADYDERHPDGDAVVVTTRWRLDAEDRAAVQQRFGREGVPSDEFTVERGYGSKNVWQVKFNQPAIVAHLLGTADLHDEERKALASAKTLADLEAKLGTPGDDSPRLAALAARMKEEFPEASPYNAFWAVVSLPKFMLFSQYQRMEGQVSLDQIQARLKNPTDNDQVFLALCAMAGTTVAEAASINKFESIVARFESASNKISSEIFSYWTQNRYLKVQFRLDMGQPGDAAPFNSGRIVRTRVYNELHEVTVPFDDRSTGFVWFFSFLALFSQVKKQHKGQIVLLLDEPGLSLHGKAQADLLRYFKEKLAPSHQVLYTTHSPFMVPQENLLACRTVEDEIVQRDQQKPEVHGTKVGSDVLSTDKDTIFPLQAALGYEITQSLFVGEHTLIVEGPSDILFLKSMSEELKAQKKAFLDQRWTICPGGGIDRVPAFISLFGGNKLHLAVLTDFATGQKKRVDEIRRSQLLRAGHVFSADAYAAQPEADIEDLLGASIYTALVNATYGLKGKQALKAPGGPGRIVKHAEDHCRTLPADISEFDHFGPAAYLAENRKAFLGAQDQPEVTAALVRFEKLFNDLNALIK
jgi:predicted ATP-dependent endonuclease of OLD family